MSRRDLWREGEARVITVTPVSQGVLRPLLITVVTIALIVDGSSRFSDVHRYEDWLALIFVVPVALVTLTRTWRWRSHKVHVTNERVIVEGGVLRHQRTMVQMVDVLATRVDQRVTERLTRRGFVYLETDAGAIPLGLVRHPGALCRIIDAERTYVESYQEPLDTVYTFDDPHSYHLEVRPDERRDVRLDAWERRPYE